MSALVGTQCAGFLRKYLLRVGMSEDAPTGQSVAVLARVMEAQSTSIDLHRRSIDRAEALG